MIDSGLTCCFCNKNILVDTVNPCDINIMPNWNNPNDKRAQTFWCHIECFKEKLHDKVRQHLYIHLFQPIDEQNEND